MSLEIKNLSKTFEEQDAVQPIPALQNITLSVNQGQFLSVIGPSGCGKTTLLRIIAGLEKASAGTVLINGALPERPWEHVGFVFQEYALFPWRTVIDNIAFGLEMKHMSKKERYTKAREYCKQFGIDGFEYCYPREISGGMRQRVAIARTLINDPTIVLMDEPFGALDSQTRSQLQTFLLQIWQRSQKTVLFITHSIDEAIFLSQHIIGLTRRPGSIGLSLPVDLAYPRDITSDEFNRYRREIIRFLNAQQNDEEYSSKASKIVTWYEYKRALC
ncbi:MAG: ABC transporter ATP-binding protein [Desulfobacterota bacterium]|nr:ABC transporter ATP-binding protein [Thermodesulfobacteriota bacterium]